MKHKLSKQLSLMIVLPIFICLVLLALVLTAFHAANEVLIRIQEENLTEIINTMQSNLETLWIKPRNHAVKALAESEVLKKRLKGEITFKELLEEWSPALKILEGTFFIYYGLVNGDIEHYPSLPLPADYDPRERPWYRAGIEANSGPVWVPPYGEIITGESVVSTVYPIRSEDGALLGVFSLDLTLADMNEIFRNLKLPRGSAVSLKDKNGRIFFSREGVPVKTADPGESLNFDSKEFHRSLSNGWLISVIVPRAALADQFRKLRNGIIISAVILTILSAFILVKSVITLIYKTRSLADYFEDVTVESKPLQILFSARDEFYFLNKQFNQAIKKGQTLYEEKRSQENIFHRLLDRAPIGFFKTRRDGSIIFVNRYCAEMFGYTEKEALGLSSIEILYEDRDERIQFLRELWEKNEVRDKKLKFRKRNGDPLWVLINAVLSPSGDNQADFEIEGFLVDITRDLEEREILQHLAETDPLTGLANRRAFTTALERFARQAKILGDSLGLITFDVDKFKHLNDTYYHQTGDQVLKHISSLGENILRKRDLFARIGGDEFAIVLPGATEEETFRMAKRFMEKLEEKDPPSGLTIRPTLSFGVCSQKGKEIDVKLLMQNADMALYRAKATGRNRICRASEIL